MTHLHLPVDEKVGLPSNIQHLDKQGMTFMKKELLGYLFKVRILSYTDFSAQYCLYRQQVLSELRSRSSEDYRCKHEKHCEGKTHNVLAGLYRVYILLYSTSIGYGRGNFTECGYTYSLHSAVMSVTKANHST